MRQDIVDQLLMFATFIVYIVLFEIWLRVAPDPGWGGIELIFLFIPVLTTVILFSFVWASVLAVLLTLLYLPVVWPSLQAGKLSFLELVMKLSLLVALGIGAEIFKRYEVKKRKKLAQLAQSLQEKVNQQKALVRAQQALGANLNLRNQFEEFLHWATELVAAKEGYIALYNPKIRRLELVSSKKNTTGNSIPEPLETALASSGDGQAKEERIERFINEMNAVPNQICVPLRVKEELIGALSLAAAKKSRYFTQNDLELISMLGAKAAVAIENARLHEFNTQLFVDSVRALAKIINARDPLTKDHSDAVALEAKVLAKKMGMDEAEASKVHLAGELHDIGRIIIPDNILKKPRRLNAREYKIVQKHPETGFELLKGIRAFREILPAVLYHHERFDGKGYPKGLKGEKIPLFARIIAVADTYDALTSPRSHRGKLSREEAANVMRDVVGTQLDPRLVEIFLQPR